VIATSYFTGSLPSWILLGVALLGAWRLSKGGGGSAVSELSKANEVLTKRVHELGSEVRDLRVENEGLRARTDFAQALAPVLEKTAEGVEQAESRQNAIMSTLDQHEARAQSRFEATTDVLGLMADQLAKLGVKEPRDGD